MMNPVFRARFYPLPQQKDRVEYGIFYALMSE